MAVVHVPRIRGNFGGVVIPRALFDGANHGLGVFCGERHPDPSAVERDVRRLAKGLGAAYSGRLDLPAGSLFAIEMPENPAKFFIQLGLRQNEVKDQINAVNLRDPGEEDVVNRWRAFQQLNHRALEGSTDAERQAFDKLRAVEVGTNGKGALVIETPFGRAFTDGGVHHAEWQTASDGLRKGQGGRGSLFLRAHDMNDWAFLARGLVAQLHRFPEQPIGTRDLDRLLEVAHTPSGPKVEMDMLRELIEAEVALVRGQEAATGRDFAESMSIGFPPHDPKDRGGRRVKFAQFSTPPAVGEVAAEFLKPAGRTILEPTVGNGVFVAAAYAAGGLVHGIEIDDARHGRVVHSLPDAKVVLGNAMHPDIYPRSLLESDGRFDAVMANPPYGNPEDVLDKVRFTDFGLELPAKKLETHIAAEAINKLRPGGNAVLVMPAQMMKPSEFTEESRRFQTMLNSVFNKVDSVVLDASLYRNMGSNFPVIVHFCEDRRPDGQPLHVAEAAKAVPASLEIMGTFAAFYGRANEILKASNIQSLTIDEANERRKVFLGADDTLDDDLADEAVADVTPPAAVEADAGPHDGVVPSAGGGRVGAVGSTTQEPSGDRAPSGGREGQGGGVPAPSVVEEPEPEPSPDDAVAPVPDAAVLMPPSETDTREWFIDDFSPDPFTVPYTPRSQKGTTLAVIERTMANETYTALRRVEEAVGTSVDKFVAERMGFDDETFMSDSVLFYPEQVDSLALSFYRRSLPRATIIGDQMGVGKGIQLAAHAYSAIAVEKRPTLFMTNRANLFSDLCIRDWKNASGKRFTDMIDTGEVRPFIFNADGALRESEKVVFATSPQDRKDAEANHSLGDSNLVMMTYSQVQTASGAWRHAAIKNWLQSNADDGVKPLILLDEAHKAAGDESRTGMVIQDLIATAERLGVEIIYSSATSLKSGKNLPVYTPALPDTGLSTGELLLAIEKMPLAMQEVLASEMAKDGALIERKMSDAGVNRDLVVLADIDPVKMDRTRVLTDRVSELLRELSDMGPVIAQEAKRQFKSALGGAAASGSMDKVRVETTSVASQLDSFSRYLMGAVKGQFVSELLQDAVARGEKPSVVCEYTADSVSEFVIGEGLPLISSAEGVAVAGHPNIGDVLKRFADKALTFKGTDGLGNITEMRVQGFDGWLDEYVGKVNDANVLDLRVNVFDRAREAAEALGMTFEDITGRKYEFRADETGAVRAFSRSKPVTVDAVARYNTGQTDCLALNSGSATGVSAQASPAHGKDVRRRNMIKLAFQREITDERQVEGRVHRAGQIVPPRYTTPVTGFAPDDRIANLFNRANRSLTSSTSATRENSTNASHAVDILNPIGERAAVQVLQRNPMVADMLQIDPEKTTDVARKLLGRSVMLPLAEQSAILSEVDATFRVIADKMNAEGTNPLRLQFYEWDAKVEEVEELIPGDPGAQGVAGQPLTLNQITYLEKVESLAAKTVFGNIMDSTRRRDEPFENMRQAWGYDTLLDRGAVKYEHHLFNSLTGRAMEGTRYLWPLPISGDMADQIMSRMQREVRLAEVKLKRSVNGDEFRDLSEQMAERIMDPDKRDNDFDPYKQQVLQKFGKDGFKGSSPAVAIRSIWNRTEQVMRLNGLLPLIEPGRMVALDVRALNSHQAGMFGNAYQKIGYENGLVPAVITSARYNADAPFAESKMTFSFFVPGSRFTERTTVSQLHTAMSLTEGDGRLAPPIRPLSVLLAGIEQKLRPSAAQQATQTAFKSIMGEEGFTRLQDKLSALNDGHDYGGFDKIVAGGLTVTEVGGSVFQSFVEAMPQDSRKMSRMTLEGNLFTAMASVSSSVANATSGEKIVYTDSDGNHRNAILLNNRNTQDLVNGVKRKVEKRAVAHSGLSSVEAVGDYLRLTNAIQCGIGYYDQSGPKEVVEALARFYPSEFDENAKVRAIENFPEVLASLRGRLNTVESVFPPSVMAGGDVWRWGTDLAQKANMSSEKPRGYVPGIGGPSSMTVRRDEDANALGFHEVEIRTGVSIHALAQAVGAIDKSQAVAVSLQKGEVIVVLHKEHHAFEGGANKCLLDRMQQQIWNAKLKSGILAGTFLLADKEDRDLVSQILVNSGSGKVELLIGGAMKEIQRGLSEEMSDRQKQRIQLGLAADKEASVSAEDSAEPTVAPELKATDPQPSYGAGGGFSGP